MIGVDLAKAVFQVDGATMTGELKFRRTLRREQFRQFMSRQPSALVAMEACGSASCRARAMIRLGHEVQLIAPQYMRPIVKRQKDDTADAEAIVVAAQRPEIGFVQPKTEAQQACAVLFRARERPLHQRTELVNGLRSALHEHGHVAPRGIAHLERIEAILAAPEVDPPQLVREECQGLLEFRLNKLLACRSDDCPGSLR